MLCAKRLVENGYSEQRAVKALGGNPYAAKKAIQSARKYSADALRDALNDFSGIDFLLRSGQARDLDALTLAVCKHF